MVGIAIDVADSPVTPKIELLKSKSRGENNLVDQIISLPRSCGVSRKPV